MPTSVPIPSRPQPGEAGSSHVVPVVAVPAVASQRRAGPASGRWLPVGAPLAARPLLDLAHVGYRAVECSETFCDAFHRPFTHVVLTPDGRTYLAILRR